MALFYPIDFYDGHVLRETVLWKYYLLTIEQQSHASGNLGPTSDNFAAMLTVLVEHIGISTILAALVATVARLTQPRQTR